MTVSASTTLIIGFGVVGNNLCSELKNLAPDVCDKYKGIVPSKSRHSFGFVCVDTPLKGETLDVSEVRNAISENDCDIYVIKSTVPVGTVDELKRTTGKRIVFSPEYYGGTQHCNNFEFPFTILGGAKEDCLAVQQHLQDVYDARHTFRVVDAKTAEMAKFMENCWLATKVAFCQDFWDSCRLFGVDYEDLRECFVLDPRVNPSHTYVYDAHPYYSSHCLDKDVPSFAKQSGSQLLSTVITENEKRKKRSSTHV